MERTRNFIFVSLSIPLLVMDSLKETKSRPQFSFRVFRRRCSSNWWIDRTTIFVRLHQSSVRRPIFSLLEKRRGPINSGHDSYLKRRKIHIPCDREEREKHREKEIAKECLREIEMLESVCLLSEELDEQIYIEISLIHWTTIPLTFISLYLLPFVTSNSTYVIYLCWK